MSKGKYEVIRGRRKVKRNIISRSAGQCVIDILSGAELDNQEFIRIYGEAFPEVSDLIQNYMKKHFTIVD